MKIAVIWYYSRASQALPNWRDGLRSAIEIIEKSHQVEWFLDEKLPGFGFDAYLLWGDSNCPAIRTISKFNGKKAICLSTNPTNTENLRFLDAVFCESDPVFEEARKAGIRAIKAFGTDTNFFTPDNTSKDIEYFYPATFSPWKRQHAIAHHGKDLLCVGTVQPDGVSEFEECKKRGVIVEEGYFPVEKIREYYKRAKRVHIPAIHGSERTVLEAMSMNILPVVYPENIKACSYVEEYKKSGCRTPREFVLKNYSAEIYAENLLKGLQ